MLFRTLGFLSSFGLYKLVFAVETEAEAPLDQDPAHEEDMSLLEGDQGAADEHEDFGMDAEQETEHADVDNQEEQENEEAAMEPYHPEFEDHHDHAEEMAEGHPAAGNRMAPGHEDMAAEPGFEESAVPDTSNPEGAEANLEQERSAEELSEIPVEIDEETVDLQEPTDEDVQRIVQQMKEQGITANELDAVDENAHANQETHEDHPEVHEDREVAEFEHESAEPDHLHENATEGSEEFEEDMSPEYEEQTSPAEDDAEGAHASPAKDDAEDSHA